MGAAAVFHNAAFNAAEEGEQATWADHRHLANQRAERNQTTANILYGVGGAAAVTSILLFMLDRDVTAAPDAPCFEKVELSGERTLTITYSKDRANAGQVLSAVQASGLSIVDVVTRDPDLEDVFLHLTAAA